MTTLYLKTFFKNISALRWRNFLINEKIPGARNAPSFIIGWGNLKYAIKKRCIHQHQQWRTTPPQ